MKYKIGKATYEIPDNEVDKLVDNLEISINEACELWLADNGKLDNQEQDELDKSVQGSKRRYERAKDRKPAVKERKVDENKKELLEIIQKALESVENLAVTGQKTETELYFEYENDKYTVKLTKHRPKK